MFVYMGFKIPSELIRFLVCAEEKKGLPKSQEVPSLIYRCSLTHTIMLMASSISILGEGVEHLCDVLTMLYMILTLVQTIY